MLYAKCRKCEYVCRCCASHFMDIWPKCSECNNSRDNFSPATHIDHCPIDGEKFRLPITDINGNIVREVKR